jgi:hypothetical protein
VCRHRLLIVILSLFLKRWWVKKFDMGIAKHAWQKKQNHCRVLHKIVHGAKSQAKAELVSEKLGSSLSQRMLHLSGRLRLALNRGI